MTKFVALVIAFGLVAIIGIYFLDSRSSSSTKTAAMKTADANYQLDRTSVDFGSITVNDTKTASFTFKNISSDSIQLSHFQTSCDCTSAIIKFGNTVSPEIGMAGMMASDAANWQGELPAGETANITVTYQPSKMPVYGAVERTAKFMANSKELTLSVKANVR